MSRSFSRSRSPSTRIQMGVVSRLRSSSSKKPTELLRRAVADSLSSPSSSWGAYHGNPSAVAFEASRTLRVRTSTHSLPTLDYLASPSTTDLACSRNNKIVRRKTVLRLHHRGFGILRYKPSEETLQQIDRFCASIIIECDVSSSKRPSPWSRSLNQQSGNSAASTKVSPSLPVTSFASMAVVKSLNYVRSLVALNIPRHSFQSAAFAGALPASRQSLPTLSSLLSKLFDSQISPANAGESSEKKDGSIISMSNLSSVEEMPGLDDVGCIAVDVLKWRWYREQQSSIIQYESDRVLSSHDAKKHSFLEVGAASLLGQSFRHIGAAEVPHLDNLLQPSSVTTASNSAAARPHLRGRTSMGTFHPRAQPLIQYRHSSEQQPLRLNPAEVSEVMAAVCSETSPQDVNLMTFSSKLMRNSGKPSIDVAVSVLIKLVIDMYVLDPGTAAPLTLSMLEEMLSSPEFASRARAFDLLLNLGVHGHLLEPMIPVDTPTIEEEYSQESYFENETPHTTQGRKRANSFYNPGTSSAIDKLESWIVGILYEILLFLVQIEEKEESVWASALSCLLYFVADRGRIRRTRLDGLDIRVIMMLLQTSRTYSWAEVVHCSLICMLTNMFYQVPGASSNAIASTPVFLVDQVDLIGGIEFIFLEYVLAKSRVERRNLYVVLFDYVLYQINETCSAHGINEYSEDEIQPVSTLLTLADAPEAFYISAKLGVEGIGEILQRSISSALSRFPNSEQLNMLLENITQNFDKIVSSFTHLDREFSHMIQITKSLKNLKGVEDVNLGTSMGMKATLSWATLHSLVHSERIAYRQNGYIWLGDLLIAEISEERDSSILENVGNLQQKISLAGVNDSSDVPLAVRIFCGLLKSKDSIIRWGFLFILERLLMRCKFLLDEKETQQSSSIEVSHRMEGDNRLEKANAVIDLMSCALLLMFQINETDRINVLKMCDILFSQLCLKVHAALATGLGGIVHFEKLYNGKNENEKDDAGQHETKMENCCFDDLWDDRNGWLDYNGQNPTCETASMAASLLQGHAIVPMQLVAHVPAALFYWPLIQLAGAATDDIGLGVAVGSKGRGNLPGASSDIRAALLLLLIGKCTAEPAAFQEVGGEEFFRELLDDTDSRRMMTEEPEKYKRILQNLVFRAQQSNNEKLLENPYLQMRGIIQLLSDLGT
ncbi:hypothetical protein RJ641_036103 [Dillenia turbinata]|uniref:Uncharacterized protein n=1 Tax=Dillenia turbinata TaxID=194707 RepID=A0AAN8ZAP7_9MAGN